LDVIGSKSCQRAGYGISTYILYVHVFGTTSLFRTTVPVCGLLRGTGSELLSVGVYEGLEQWFIQAGPMVLLRSHRTPPPPPVGVYRRGVQFQEVGRPLLDIPDQCSDFWEGSQFYYHSS